MRTLFPIVALIGSFILSDAYNHRRTNNDSDEDKFATETLRDDSQRLQDLLHNLAQLYHIKVEEVEEFIKNNHQGDKHNNLAKEDDWKLEERKQLFWLFEDGQDNNENLEEWQMDHEDRLIMVQDKFNINMEDIIQWQKKELDHYKALVSQFSTDNLNLLDWQKHEKNRIDWLIHQNKMTQKDFEQWEKDYKIKFDTLSQRYQITVQDLKEYYFQEFNRFNQQHSQIHTDNLNSFLQKEEIDRLNSNVDQLEEQIQSDQDRYNSLEQQFQTLKDESEELSRINNEKQAKMQNQLDQLDNFVHKQNQTVQEFQQKINSDRRRLNSLKNIQQLSIEYSVSFEEIEEMIKDKFRSNLKTKDQSLETKPMSDWQTSEREHLLQFFKPKSNFSVLELLEQQLAADHIHLEELANRNNISVEEIEDWIRNEAEELENQGKIGNLKDWQKSERSRIHKMLKESYLTIEKFEEDLKKDYARLQHLAYQYQTTVKEVEGWILKECNRQIHREFLASWQMSERNWLENLILNENITLNELERTIENEQNRIEQLADVNHLTGEEIKEYIKVEGERLWESKTDRQLSNDKNEYILDLVDEKIEENYQVVKSNTDARSEEIDGSGWDEYDNEISI